MTTYTTVLSSVQDKDCFVQLSTMQCKAKENKTNKSELGLWSADQMFRLCPNAFKFHTSVVRTFETRTKTSLSYMTVSQHVLWPQLRSLICFLILFFSYTCLWKTKRTNTKKAFTVDLASEHIQSCLQLTALLQRKWIAVATCIPINICRQV